MMMLQGGDGTAEDDEAFWAKLEADSGRATGGSSAPVSSASSEVRSTVFLETIEELSRTALDERGSDKMKQTRS